MRVPYPLGFYSRGLDGRIDDPRAGWKGRGVWADYGTNLVWHIEGGKRAQRAREVPDAAESAGEVKRRNRTAP